MGPVYGRFTFLFQEFSQALLRELVYAVKWRDNQMTEAKVGVVPNPTNKQKGVKITACKKGIG